MKSKFYFFMTGAMFLSGIICANAQNGASNNSASKMLKDCYIAYNTAWAKTSGNILHKKLDSLQQKYCTDQLITRLKNMGPDFDLLGFNQYTDVKHLNTLKVTKDANDDNLYSVSYIVHTTHDTKSEDVKVDIQVSVEKEPGGFRIAYVK
jgi:hypothetical protein